MSQPASSANPHPTPSHNHTRTSSTESQTQRQKNQEMLSQIRSTAPSLLHKLQTGLSKLPVELVWAAHSHWPLRYPNTTSSPTASPSSGQKSQRPIRISILDSSFNPPTLAHLALANSPRPRYTSEQGDGDCGEPPDYDAKLLLLSVKNADKSLKPGDATYLQRLEMMGLLAQDVHTHPASHHGHNVAIAIIDEPTFVGKSRVLQEYLRVRLASLSPTPSPADSDSEVQGHPTQLSFIVGLDTLERLFSPRYYAPAPGEDESVTAEQNMISALSRMLSPYPSGDDSLIVCARRAVTLPSDVAPKSACLEIGERMGWMKSSTRQDSEESGERLHGSLGSATIPKDERIVMIDIGDRESRFSSTAVRNARFRAGDSGSHAEGPWKEWVTKSVAEYIEEGGLYIQQS
ncbi:hypothetical protein D9611_001407 [Ephemerocybe angulata]|uniref:Nicotinamide-nucleotide adenylyltransferase n=1 Tax=Ephemerocybe angulata TaxID=980116 RepID=A0A8H5CIY2_9AGAR|nr:hypothetical protein D9611_001407 [Tulosesus angulatus]